MAIYHFSAKIISRSEGKSAVASASYRSCSELMDERTNTVHDYTKKQDLAHSEILLPENAPGRFLDRETLWNEVERTEKRKDSQLARDFNMSLPRELTLEQNIAITREFVEREFVAKGMIGDVNIHVDKAADGESQPHAHVMLTMREVTEEGFGQKVRAWNDKENLLTWREAWSETVNRHLAMHGHDVRIDHRSYETQGINLEPQYKIGPNAARHRSDALADHQRIARANGERLFKDPDIAFQALTQQQATFTHQDIAKFVNRHSADAEQFEVVYNKLLGDEKLVQLGQDEQGRARFTTREMLTLEQKMMQQAEVMHKSSSHDMPSQSLLERVASEKKLSEQQREVVTHLVESGSLKCAVGYAGTGKSYSLGAAREVWEAQGYRVQGVALAGIAAEGLQEGSGIQSRTVASLLYRWDRGDIDAELTSKDVLVVDEAGMLGSRQVARLLEEAYDKGAKVVLVGDPQQLQAIQAGAAFRAIIERTSAIELTEVRRQREAWQRDATVAFARGNTQGALKQYEDNHHTHEFATHAEAKLALVDMWNDSRMLQKDATQIMLAYTRIDVKDLNEHARELRRLNNELGEDHAIKTERGERAFAEHDRIYFLKNDRNLGVMNGSLGTIKAIHGNALTVQLDKEDSTGKSQTISVDTTKYNQLEYGYAATIHKAQGVTVDKTYVLASKYMDAHATYVAMSRHRDRVELFHSKCEFSNKQELFGSLSRERAKDVALDYGVADHELSMPPGLDPATESLKALGVDEKTAQLLVRYASAAKVYRGISEKFLDAVGTEHESKSREFLTKSRNDKESIIAEILKDEKVVTGLTKINVPQKQPDISELIGKSQSNATNLDKSLYAATAGEANKEQWAMIVNDFKEASRALNQSQTRGKGKSI